MSKPMVKRRTRATKTKPTFLDDDDEADSKPTPPKPAFNQSFNPAAANTLPPPISPAPTPPPVVKPQEDIEVPDFLKDAFSTEPA